MIENNFPPFPSLITQNLVLRQLSEEDAPALSSLRSDPRVNKYIIRPARCSDEKAKAFILGINNDLAQGKCFYWAISTGENAELIGTICLWNFSGDKKTAEIGYELHPSFHGKGLMSEAVEAVMKFSWEALKLKKLEAFTHRENSRSKKLLEKKGFIAGGKDKINPDFIIYCIAAPFG
jgi:[ribosomal protein S5]-alanine N-acetyltransferase